MRPISSEGNQDRCHLAVSTGQVVPQQDHRDAPRESDEDDAGSVCRLVGQQEPGEGEHHQRANDPVHQQ